VVVGDQFLEQGLLGPLPEREFLGEYSKAVGGVDSEAEEQGGYAESWAGLYANGYVRVWVFGCCCCCWELPNEDTELYP